MADLDIFTEAVPWFIDGDADIRVSASVNGLQLPPAVANSLPLLATLLEQSLVTPIAIGDADYQLFAWDAADGARTGWLCSQPATESTENIHPDHAALLTSFGGIVEIFNEPDDTWLLNCNNALTASEAAHDASFIDEYMWAFTDAGVELPIQPSDYYCISREANGNTTLCHRTTGQVILFAADHAFDFVVPLSGCPDYTLYQLNAVETFRDWVDVVANQWLAHTRSAR